MTFGFILPGASYPAPGYSETIGLSFDWSTTTGALHNFQICESGPLVFPSTPSYEEVIPTTEINLGYVPGSYQY